MVRQFQYRMGTTRWKTLRDINFRIAEILHEFKTQQTQSQFSTVKSLTASKKGQVSALDVIIENYSL
jgi:hypothetical protein